MRERNPEIIKEYLSADICANLPKSFPKLYERIVYIILKFLQTEEKVLFLQFPIEDLSNKEKKKSQYWDEICDVIAYAIRLSMRLCKLQPSELLYPGDWYKKGDNFLLLSPPNAKYPYFFLNAIEKNKQPMLTFQCGNSDFRGAKKSEKIQFIQNARVIYELNACPAHLNSGYERCCTELEFLKCRRFENEQFSTAVAICPAYSHTLPHAGTYVKPTVDIRRTNPDYPPSDILAIVGDNAFGLVQGAINSLAPYGPTKKVLAFGTQPTEPLLESKPVTITLSFQEIHAYCAPNNVKYFAPEFIEIDFQWLKDVLIALKDILEKYFEQLGDTICKHIYNLTRSILADIEFSNEKLERFKEYFVKFLEDRIQEEEAPDFYDEIMIWLDRLSYDSESNPKQNYVRNKGGIIILSDRSISKQLKGQEAYGSKFILDSPCHVCQGDDNPISTVMRYHLFPQLRCIYYKDIETLIKNRAEKNISKDPFFSVDAVPASPHLEVSGVVKLEDYFDLETYQRDFYSVVYGAENVVFTDGSNEQLSGDVILSMNDKLKRIPVTNIMEKEGKTIIYYSQNTSNREIFNHLFNEYHNFPEGKDVDYYVTIWQDALRKLIEQTPKESLEALCKELKITKSVLKNHIDSKSKFMRNSKFDKVLDVLKAKGLITDEDKQYIKAAKKFYNSNSISFGSKLKDALYIFRLDNNKKSSFLKELESRTGYTAEKLMNEFLCSKTIKE